MFRLYTSIQIKEGSSSALLNKWGNLDEKLIDILYKISIFILKSSISGKFPT